jgi:excisionase family DNA binding protein
MPTEKPKRWWLSAAEAAELLGVTSKTVKRWMAAKRMPGFRLNRTGEHRVLVVHFIRFCNDSESSYAVERFNEQYTYEPLADVLRTQGGNPQAGNPNGS